MLKEAILATVTIIGRPNVGKSTLFNRLAGKRKALVHNQPGVTRDLNYIEISAEGKKFLLVDTGGIVGATEDPLHALVQEQAEMAIENSELVLFLVDSKEGLLPVEKELAVKLRKHQKKIILVVNKMDDEKHKFKKNEFYALGIEPIFGVSAEHGNGIDELLKEIVNNIEEKETNEEKRETIKIAIVGKPNVGKSSVLNRILGKKRALVSEFAGTTRDPVDETIVLHDQIFTFVDTAGIRKKSKTEKGAEILSVILARKALENCNVALQVVDVSLFPSHQDAYIAGLIRESRKGGIILLNKWDKIETEKEAKETELLFKEKFDFVPYIPQMKVSALTGKGFRSVFPKINSVYKSFRMKVSTSELNKALNTVIRGVAPPAVSGKEFKIKYGTQVSTSPPRFILFTNCDEDPPENYIRYIKNRFYEIFKIEGTPLIINFRRK